MNRFVTFLRAALTVQLTKKDLRLSLSEARTAASVGLMTADVETIVQSFQDIGDFVVMFPEIGLALYLLWRIVGKSFFLTLIYIIGEPTAAASNSYANTERSRFRQFMANWQEERPSFRKVEQSYTRSNFRGYYSHCANERHSHDWPGQGYWRLHTVVERA